MEVGYNISFTPKAMRDYSLVRSAVDKNDQRAYAELMNSYREPLYTLMFKMVNNTYDAEDLTIEAFGKAFRNLSRYSSNYAFSTWLFSIASNNCVDFLRKKRPDFYEIDKDFDKNEENYTPFELNDDKPTPEERLFAKEKSKLIRQYVSMLKPHYRELVELRYFEELSYEEISERLEIPMGSVKAKLFRAKEMLQAVMKEEMFTYL
ncbi:MAG: sigma-70 family RNA polymerase sigma factor [Lentimicrobiaceae bacterium]|nr:sigma-70 family RNA polymerase sigma factor [Lentimicrobiaceae bacterium]